MSKCMIMLVRLYQVTLGRVLCFLAGGHSVCIYEPTCSQYMITALQTHGPLKGLALGIWRICRCHPFARGGLDPVPTAAGATGRKHTDTGPEAGSIEARI